MDHGSYYVVASENGTKYLCGPSHAVCLYQCVDMQRGFSVRANALHIPKTAIKRMLRYGYRRGRIHSRTHGYRFSYRLIGETQVETLVVGCQTFPHVSVAILRQWCGLGPVKP